MLFKNAEKLWNCFESKASMNSLWELYRYIKIRIGFGILAPFDLQASASLKNASSEANLGLKFFLFKVQRLYKSFHAHFFWFKFRVFARCRS